MEVTPTVWGGEARLFQVDPSARRLTLAGVPRGIAMVCSGAAYRASGCRRTWLAAGQAVEMEEPARGVRVVGRALLGRSPAVGVRISVVPEGLIARREFTMPLDLAPDGKSLVREVRTDARGSFALPQLAPGRYFLEAQSPGARAAQSEPFTVPDPSKLQRKGDDPAKPASLDLGDWTVEDGVTMAVSVADDRGSPVAGARISALEIGTARAPGVSEARAGRNGRASLTRLDPGLALKVVCRAPGFAPSEETFDHPPDEAHCTLLRLASLAGEVLGGDGKPLRAATVALQATRRTTTGPGGSFVLAGLAPGRYRLEAAAPGFRAETRTVDIAPGEQRSLGALRLSPADPLWGQVVAEASGDPIAGARIAVTRPAGGGEAESDGEGRFTLAAASASGVTLEIHAPGLPAKRVDVAEARRTSEDDPLVIRLAEGGRVQLAVWDEGADAPCLGCTVDLTGPGEGVQSLITDVNGEATSEPIEPGEWSAYLETVESRGSTVEVHSGDAVRRVMVRAGAASRVEFGHRATLRVVFTAPVPSGWSLAASGPSFTSVVHAGEDGAFRVRRADGEPMTLALVDGSLRQVRQAVVPADYADPVLTLALASTRVSGTLFKGDQPLTDQGLDLVGVAGGRMASAVAGQGGGFEIPFVPPGVYSLTVEGKVARVIEVRDRETVDLGVVRVP